MTQVTSHVMIDVIVRGHSETKTTLFSNTNFILHSLIDKRDVCQFPGGTMPYRKPSMTTSKGTPNIVCTVLCKKNANEFRRHSPFVYTNSRGYFRQSYLILRITFRRDNALPRENLPTTAKIHSSTNDMSQ